MTNTHQGLQIPVGYYFCSRSATVHLHQAGLDCGWKIIDKPNPASSPHQFTQTAYLIVHGGGAGRRRQTFLQTLSSAKFVYVLNKNNKMRDQIETDGCIAASPPPLQRSHSSTPHNITTTVSGESNWREGKQRQKMIS